MTLSFSDADFALERERLVNEARTLIKDAGDQPLSEDATARFSAIESRLTELRAEAEKPPEIISNHPMPGQRRVGRDDPDRHPLSFASGTLDLLQQALDSRSPGRFVAADPGQSVMFAALTTATHGAPRAWGRNVLDGPRLLHQVAGVPRQTVAAALAQHPTLSLPTATAAAAEGASLVEYASSTAGSVTLGRFGRWTDLTQESLLGADAGAVTGAHRIGIALDMDNALISAVNTAAGAAVAFTADVPAAIRTAMARVSAATASGDAGDLVVLAHPDNAALLQDVAPTGGETMGERFNRFSGALVYPSTAVPTGFVLVANLRAGARYFEARGLTTVTDSNVKTGVETVASFLIGGYGITLGAGFASKIDVVTP